MINIIPLQRRSDVPNEQAVNFTQDNFITPSIVGRLRGVEGERKAAEDSFLSGASFPRRKSLSLVNPYDAISRGEDKGGNYISRSVLYPGVVLSWEMECCETENVGECYRKIVVRERYARDAHRVARTPCIDFLIFDAFPKTRSNWRKGFLKAARRCIYPRQTSP